MPEKNTKETYFFQWSESQSGFVTEASARAFDEHAKLMAGYSFGAVVLSERRNTHTYISKEYEKSAAKYAKKFLSSKQRQEFLAWIESAKSRFTGLHLKFSCTDARKCLNAELLEFFEEFMRCEIEIITIFNFLQAEFTELPKIEMEKGLKKYFEPTQVPEILSELLMPDALDAIKREEIDLTQLALRGHGEKALKDHALKHSILFYNSYREKTNFDFLEQRMRELSKYGTKQLDEKIAGMQNEIIGLKKRQAAIEKKIPDAQTKELARFLRELSFQRLELKGFWAGSEYRFLPLFVEITRRLEIGLNELMSTYFTEDVIEGLKTGKLLEVEESGTRKETYLFYRKNGKTFAESGKKAIELAKKLVPNHFAQIKGDKVIGSCANPGYATGKARVVKVVGIDELEKDMKNFEKGEILITTMTQPNMVALARKAAAIVTNEGGITSHAAVLAREFKIPCVVGTLTATRIINTGDEIAVNATEGVVRLLKKV